jgi:regulator of protease activity HflC (stomatin/prohibitin superfamily)
MVEDTFQSNVVVLTIVVFIAATILLVAFRLYRRRRSTQRGLGYEQSSLSSSPSTSRKPRVSLAMPNFPKVQNKLKILAAFVTVVIVIIVLAESVVIVQAGHRGVVLYLGAVENRVLGEGWHFITPFAEQVIQLEVRTLKYEADASAASNDLQEVQTVIALNFHIDPSQTNTIYQQLGENYANRIIAPTIQESVKASVAKFNAEELITKREIAKGVIAEAIRKTLSERDILVETVFITDFKFSEAFSNQIESKVVAYQKFLTEQNNLKAVQVIANQTVVQAEAQARANVAKANGESQAIRIINEQLKESPDYLQWQAINRWNGQMPYALGSGGFPFFQLPIQVQNQTGQIIK